MMIIDSDEFFILKRKLFKFSSVLYFLPAIFIILILIFLNNFAYCATEDDRLAFGQRARIELEEILKAKEFRDQELQSSWLSRWLDRILNRLLGGAEWLVSLIKLLFYLAIIALIIFIFIVVSRRFRELSPRTNIDSVSPVTDNHRDPEAAKIQAYEYLQQGEYRNAIRCLHLSLLLYLDKSDILTYDVARTNGEYLTEFRSKMNEQADRFAFITKFFERKWYGIEESDAGDFQQCESVFIELVGE